MNCEELLKALNEYVDGEKIDISICEEFKHHLSDCNPCQIVVDNIRQTITLYKDGKPFILHEGFRKKLHQSLKEKWEMINVADSENQPADE